MSFIFLGANRIGIACLNEILRRGIKVDLVIVRRQDSGQDGDAFPSLKKFALSRKLEVIQPEKINSDGVLAKMSKMRTDWLVSIQYDQILGRKLLEIPQFKINLHFGVLPKCRGCFPIAWAMIEGHPVGATLHVLDEGIDTGSIIAKTEVPMNQKETAQSAYQKVEKAAFSLFKEKFFKIYETGKILAVPQEGEAVYHPAGYPYDRWIDWNWDIEKIDRFIRALTFPPFPSARMILLGQEIEILHPIRAFRIPETSHRPGEMILMDRDKLRMKARNGVVEIQEIRIKGQKAKISDLMCEKPD